MISKFGTKMHLSTVKVPVDSDPQFHFQFQTCLLVLPNFAFLIHLRRFIYISREHCHIPYGYTHMLIHVHAAGSGHGPWNGLVYFYLGETIEVQPLRLCDWHWILQAAIDFRHIEHTSHAEFLYAIFRQLPKQPLNSTHEPLFCSTSNSWIARLRLHQRYFSVIKTTTPLLLPLPSNRFSW